MDKTLFYHGKTKDGARYTIAGKYETPTKILMAISLCTVRDPFIKKLGRVRAEGRLKAKSCFGVSEYVFIEAPEAGKEINIFCHYAATYGSWDSKELKRKFNLHKK